jgi:hypothetical protein
MAVADPPRCAQNSLRKEITDVDLLAPCTARTAALLHRNASRSPFDYQEHTNLAVSV